MTTSRHAAARATRNAGRRRSLRAAPMSIALAALAFAFALSGVLPVSGEEGSEPVLDTPAADWTATLTVGVHGTGSQTTHGYSIFQGGMGTLSENTFNEDEQSIDVVAILLSNGFLAFNLKPEPSDHFVLTVDGTEFASADASEVKSRSITSYVWATTQVWAEDDTVALSLSWTEAEDASQEAEAVIVKDAPPPTAVVLPARPSGLSATATHDSVSLTWNDPSDATITHYQVFRRDTAIHGIGVFITLVDNTGSAATSYTDGTVESEKKYVYRVKAVNAQGASRWSSFSSVRTPVAPVAVVVADPPPAAEDLAPTGLTARLAEGGGVSLSWTAPAEDAGNVSGYEILRAAGDAESTTLVADTSSTATTYTDASATTAGETYAYQVKAIRGGARSQASAEASVELPAAPPDPPPDPLPVPTITACEFDAGGSDLPADTSSGCALEVDGSVRGERATAGDVDWYRLSLQASATYQTDMRGKSTGGWQLVDGAPAFVSVGTLEDPKLLGIYDASGVLVSGTDSEVAGTGKDSRIASFSPAADGVYFVSASAESGWTGTYELSLTVTAGQHVKDLSLLAPSGLTAATQDGGGVALSWTEPAAVAASVDGYRILRGVGAGEMSTLVTDTESTTTSYTDATATEAGTTYVFQVIALRGDAASQGSAKTSITIPAATSLKSVPEADESVPEDLSAAEQVLETSNPPQKPQELKAISVTHATVELGWTAPDDSDVTGYLIKRRLDPGGAFSEIATITGSASTSYTDTSVSPSTAYVYQVRAYNAGGVGDPSNNLKVSTLDAPEAVGGFQQVDAGWGHICALRMDGTVHCWGTFVRGVTRPYPSDELPEGTFTQIVAGNDSSCGIRSDGSALCWNDGQRLGPIANEKPKQQIHTYTQSGVCWLNQDGSVGCAGYHHHEPSESNYTHVTTGWEFACALTVDSDVICWNNSQRIDPPAGKFSFIQAGGSRVCGIRKDDDPNDGVDVDGDLVCWEFGGPGHTGGSWYPNAYHLETTTPEGKFQHVDLHYTQTCGVTTDGDIKCWMRDDSGATSLVRNVPRVAPTGVFSEVSIDWYMRVCALKTDQTISCWKGTGEEVWTPSFDSPWKDNAKLLSLELSGIDLDFDRDTASYTLSVDNDVASTTVTTGATNTQATVAISPTDADSSSDGHQVNLTAGSTTTITVTVTAADGITTQAYTIAITRASS